MLLCVCCVCQRRCPTRLTRVSRMCRPSHPLAVGGDVAEDSLPGGRQIGQRHDELVGLGQIDDVLVIVQTKDLHVQGVGPEPTLDTVDVAVPSHRDEDVCLVVGRIERADLHNVVHRSQWHHPTRPNSWAGAGGCCWED